MKTDKIFAVLLPFIATAAFGQVLYNIRDAFQSKYPKAVVSNFGHTDKNYVARFK